MFHSVEKLQPGHLVDSVKGIVNLDVDPLENKLVSKLSSLKLNTRL